MPKKEPAVAAKKPLSVWKKPITLQPAKFVASLAKGIYDAATKDWRSLGEDLEQAVEATGLGTAPGELAWKLVLRATVRGMFDLIQQTNPFPAAATKPDPQKLAKGLEEVLGKTALSLDHSFFDKPGDLPLLAAISSPLSEWLAAHGASSAEARSMARRLPS